EQTQQHEHAGNHELDCVNRDGDGGDHPVRSWSVGAYKPCTSAVIPRGRAERGSRNRPAVRRRQPSNTSSTTPAAWSAPKVCSSRSRTSSREWPWSRRSIASERTISSCEEPGAAPTDGETTCGASDGLA